MPDLSQSSQIVLSKEAYDTLLAQAQQYQTLVDQLKAKEKLEESQRLEYSKDELSEISIQKISHIPPSNLNKLDTQAEEHVDQQLVEQLKFNEEKQSKRESDKDSQNKQQ